MKFAKVGTQFFCYPSNRKSTNSWGHSASKFRKILRCGSPQIAYICKVKSYVFVDLRKSAKTIGSANPQIAKIHGRQVANPQIATFAEGTQKKNLYYKFANLRTCDLRNLFADRPPLVICYCRLYCHLGKCSILHRCLLSFR